MKNAGKINIGALLFLVLISSGIYVVVKVAPFYVDHMDVQEAVEAAHNLSGRNSNDGLLINEIRQRTSQMGTHIETDSWGVDREVPGLGLTEDQILIERSRITDNVRIEVNYEREVDFSLINYTHVLKMRALKEGIPPR